MIKFVKIKLHMESMSERCIQNFAFVHNPISIQYLLYDYKWKQIDKRKWILNKNWGRRLQNVSKNDKRGKEFIRDF